jgi:hypothetical protein
VVDAPYPSAWDPLAAPAAPDCRRYQGTYGDRGEAPGQVARPSLTRELLGQDSPWEQATSVRLELTADGAAVTVNGAAPSVHHFSGKAGDVQCAQGKLVLRHRRWVVSDLMSGRETMKLELHEAEPFLVAHAHESMTGVMFMVVPLAGESVRWFRFPRLGP